jgi:hypothetical protein
VQLCATDRAENERQVGKPAGYQADKSSVQLDTSAEHWC